MRLVKTAPQLGASIRAARTARGWSQAQLAERAGVSRLWLSQTERGKRSVEVGLVLHVLAELGLAIQIVETSVDQTSVDHAATPGNAADAPANPTW